MKNFHILCLSALSLLVGRTAAADTSQAAQQAAEKEIRAAAASFVEAFQKRDAAAIAAHWTPEGVYVDEEGERFEGRKSIAAEYEALFKNSPENLELKLEIDSIRLIGPQTAVEEGRAALAPQPPGQSRVMSQYTAVHVKQEGRWLMADVRDALVELPPEAGQLSDLEWLVGSWTAGEKEVQLAVTVRWIENKQFLARNHVVTESGKETSSGLEIIGLDRSTGRITSWTFSSDGGRAVGIWAPQNNGWLIESEGVLADATTTSATYVLSRQDNDTLVWKSLNRVGGEATLPDLAEVALKRK